jgi:hypothetical protein
LSIKGKSLLIYAYHSKGIIEKTTEVLLSELSNYFDDVVVSTDYGGIVDQKLPYTFLYFKNRGYDFGFFYNSLKKINLSKYDRIALINDSNVLAKNGTFKNIFEWSKKEKYDVWGLTDSIEKRPEVSKENAYHLQSHFLVFEKKAIPHLVSFFNDIEFEKNILSLRSNKDIRKKVILQCEYGISRYMLSKGLKIGAKWSVQNWSLVRGEAKNMHFWFWEDLIKDGYPVMKKKIYDGTWGTKKEGAEGWSKLPNYKNKWKYIII